MDAFTDHDRELLQQVAGWSGPNGLADLDADYLSAVSRTKGVDFATALLYHRVRSSTEHGEFIAHIESLLHDAAPRHKEIDAALVIVPGAFYREHPQTGADGRALASMAASLGCRTSVIPTESVGNSDINGRIICQWLLEQREKRIIVCSLSKGGADMKMALADEQAPAAFRNVVAWLNVGGIPAGSPMVDWLIARRWLASIYRFLFWCRGQDFEFIRSLARRPGSPLDFPVSWPPHLRVIHVVGFPLTQHLWGRRTRRWHRRLAHFGPNDGATILADSCSLPGLIYPAWAADHYLDARHRPEVLLAALLLYLGDELRLSTRPARTASLIGSSVTA